MKKYYQLIYLAALMTAVSCSIREDRPAGTIDDSDAASLELSVTMSQTQTKGLMTGTTFSDGSEIGIALCEENGKPYDNLPYSNVRFCAEGTGSSQQWTPETDVMLSTTKASLYAYYPYSSDITDIASIRIKADSDTQTDWMYAVPVTEMNNRSNKASVNMRHALSAVRLSLKRGSYTGTGNVTAVSMHGNNMATGGRLDAKTGKISSITGTGTAISPQISPIVLTSAFQDIDIIAVPTGSAASAEMKIVIDGTEFILETSSFNLEQGKIAVFEATVDNSSINLSSVKIRDWTYTTAGTPVIRHDWTISLEGDIENISFANTINDDGSIQIIAVPIPLDASVDPVTVEGEVTYTETTDLERGTRTIILSEISSDVTVTFAGYSLWTTAIYEIEDISEPTEIIGLFVPSTMKRMVVDGVEVTPSTKYQFTETGTHQVKFSFEPFINSNKLLAKYHLPELGFQDVATVTEIRLAEGYTLLRNQVFSRCDKLKKVVMPSTLTSIGYNTFYYCEAIEEISFPDNVTWFADSQCYNCRSLKKVKLPANLKSLGQFTFNGCKLLTEIDIPSGVTEIGYGAFKYSGIQKLHIPDGVSIFPPEMCMECRSLTELRLPANLQQIQRQTLYNCTSLSKIIQADGTEQTNEFTIPEGVTTVGELAVLGGLFTKIHLPSTLSKIDYSGLANANLEAYTMNDANTVYDMRSGAVVETATDILVAGCVSSLIDPTVKIIGTRSFYDSKITKLDLPESITEIMDEGLIATDAKLVISRALTPPKLGDKPFWIMEYYGTLKVPAEAYDAYKEQWMKNDIGHLGWSGGGWQIKTLAEGE